MQPLQASRSHPSGDIGAWLRRRAPSERTPAAPAAIAAPALLSTSAFPADALTIASKGVAIEGRSTQARRADGDFPWAALSCSPNNQTLMASFRSLPGNFLQAEINAWSPLETEGPKVVITNEHTREGRKPERHSAATMRRSGYILLTSARK